MDRRHFIKLGIAGATVAVGGMLAGCAGGAEAPAPRSETHPQPQAETPSTSAATEPAAPKGTPVVTGNSLVIYYSHPEITAASDPANLTEAEENSAVVVDGEILGNTQFVAQIIARETGAELHRIETPHEYPTDHRELTNQAQQELNSGFRPEITGGIPDLSAYDTIFFGHPIWWAQLPPTVTSFLEQADFSDKNVFLFNTHGGSGDAGTPATIKALQPGASVSSDNYVVSRDAVAGAEPAIVAWVSGLPR